MVFTIHGAIALIARIVGMVVAVGEVVGVGVGEVAELVLVPQ